MKRRFLLILPLAFVLSACSSAPSWVQGDWHYDSVRTEQELKVSQASGTGSNSSSGFLGNMMSGLAATIDAQLVQQLAGMEIIIDGTERIVIVGGQGKSEPYQVVKSSSDECLLKLKDNTVETYYRDGDDIYSYSTGAGAFKIYFKRQP